MIDQSFGAVTSLKNKVVEDIISCGLQDDSGLNDFQKLPTEDLISIPRVGINNFRLPIELTNKLGEKRSHDCTASMYVSLNANKNGVSMSRLCTILQSTAAEQSVGANFFRAVLHRYKDELRDEADITAGDEIDTVFLRLKFNFPIRQKSLKSGNWGWQYYPVQLEARECKTNGSGFEFFISIDYEYSSTCPCSLSMAKQYEREFAEGKTTQGTGIGVPHSQRSKMTCKVQIEAQAEFYLEDLITIIRTAIPTETQSLVKRQDEQAFAILNGAHPMFVEHASKRIYKGLNSDVRILDWLVQIEHLESLHSHNAAAVIYKGVQGGLRADTIF